MSRNCLSGVPVDWLLIFLLLLSDLSSADENTYVQDDTVVCAEGEARFNWKYKVKPSFAIVWTYNGETIASSAFLTFEPEVISSDQFKWRLKLISKDPFEFTLENATEVDNGTYECFFHFDDGKTDYVMGKLEVKEWVKNDSLVNPVEQNDSCVTLSCRANPPCTWTFPNGTTRVAKKIRYCSKKTINETIKCESDHVCTSAIYQDFPSCNKSETKRQRRSPDDTCGDSNSDDNLSSSDDSNSDGTDPGTDPGTYPGTDPGTDPGNHVPIVLGVLVPITAIAVITVMIVFYKRRSRNQGVQGPPVHYEPASKEDNQDM